MWPQVVLTFLRGCCWFHFRSLWTLLLQNGWRFLANKWKMAVSKLSTSLENTYLTQKFFGIFLSYQRLDRWKIFKPAQCSFMLTISHPWWHFNKLVQGCIPIFARSMIRVESFNTGSSSGSFKMAREGSNIYCGSIKVFIPCASIGCVWNSLIDRNWGAKESWPAAR